MTGVDGRTRILAAARRLFPERGYEGTTMRAIAAAAGVDVALIGHHFGSKRALWEIATNLPVDPAELAARLAGVGAAQAGRAVIGLIAEVWLGPEGPALTARLRGLLETPEGLAGFRRVLDDVFWDRIAAELAATGYPDAALRVELAQATVFGAFIGRMLLDGPALSMLDAAGMVDCVGPVVQWHLTGRPIRDADLPAAGAAADPGQERLF